MPIKTILVPLYDGALDTVVVDAAAKLAGKFNAHIETLLMKVPLDITGGLISNMLDTKQYKQLIDDLARQTQSEENAAREKFEQIISNAGIVSCDDPSRNTNPSASWRIDAGDPAEVLARCGGAFDLIVAGHPFSGSETSKTTQVLNAAIFNTARPVLLTSQTITPTIGEVILLAWNRGIPAGRALLAAHPFLEKAKRVVIFMIATDAKQGPEPEDISKNLAWHGIAADVKKVAPSSRPVADILTDEVEAIGADLLVMGAYSQSRVRERMLGGVTKAIMARAGLPVLMAR
jgi:nucleotide-binding universal stress UspA family protein